MPGEAATKEKNVMWVCGGQGFVEGWGGNSASVAFGLMLQILTWIATKAGRSYDPTTGHTVSFRDWASADLAEQAGGHRFEAGWIHPSHTLKLFWLRGSLPTVLGRLLRATLQVPDVCLPEIKPRSLGHREGGARLRDQRG